MTEARLVTLADLRDAIEKVRDADPSSWLRFGDEADAIFAALAAAPAEGLDEIALNAIRYRAAEGHGFAVEDRAWLLRYIDRAALARHESGGTHKHQHFGPEGVVAS